MFLSTVLQLIVLLPFSLLFWFVPNSRRIIEWLKNAEEHLVWNKSNSK